MHRSSHPNFYFNLVSGSMGAWSNLTNCSAACGPGSISRYRACDSPAPINNGDLCENYERTSLVMNETVNFTCQLTACTSKLLIVYLFDNIIIFFTIIICITIIIVTIIIIIAITITIIINITTGLSYYVSAWVIIFHCNYIVLLSIRCISLFSSSW